jgi:hypothetical protein
VAVLRYFNEVSIAAVRHGRDPSDTLPYCCV